MAAADAVGAAPARLPRMVMRLDDGTVIKSTGSGGGAAAVQRLTPEQAFAQGLLLESHLLQAQSMLCEVHSKLPEEGPLKSISTGSKRSIDTVFEVNAGGGLPVPPS